MLPASRPCTCSKPVCACAESLGAEADLADSRAGQGPSPMDADFAGSQEASAAAQFKQVLARASDRLCLHFFLQKINSWSGTAQLGQSRWLLL